MKEKGNLGFFYLCCLFLIIIWICSLNNVLAQPPVLEGVKINKKRLETSSNLTYIYFLNEKDGWILSKNHLFKTNDGGVKWQKKSLRILPSEKLAQIHFRNSKSGILVVQKELINLDDEKNYFQILETLDGGETWEKGRLEINGIVRSLVFSDEKNGWIAGYKKKGHSLIGFKYLLLKTNDGGKTWQDFSSQVEFEIIGDTKPVNYEAQNKAILGASLNNIGDIQLFINNRIILTSSNNGRTWNKTQIEDKGKSFATFCCFGNIQNQQSWYSRAAKSYEGIYGEIGIINNDQEVKWNGIGKVFFEKVIYLTESKFIALGSYFVKSQKKEGIILYTADNGITWRTLYHDKKILSFNSIAKTSDKALIAGGSMGSLILINLP